MKGVDLTLTGETLDTPSPAELVNLFKRSPKGGLNFGKIFEFEEGDSGEQESEERHEDGPGSSSPQPELKEKGKIKDEDKDDASSENSISSGNKKAVNCRSGSSTDDNSSILDTFFPPCVAQSTRDFGNIYLRSCWVQ
jgi:hypothetical protein